jgi:hypothetical protein
MSDEPEEVVFLQIERTLHRGRRDEYGAVSMSGGL